MSYLVSLVLVLVGLVGTAVRERSAGYAFGGGLVAMMAVVLGYTLRIELAGKSLEFSPWDEERYPMLRLAYDAAETGGSAPVVYNAANEVAVDAFLAKRIHFTHIARVVDASLSSVTKGTLDDVQEILDADREARIQAEKSIRRIAG